MTDRRNDREADRLAAEAAAVLQGADDRRRRGAFFTPPDVAAALVGHVVGGGFLLAAACDLRVAAAETCFLIPEVDLGVPLLWGGLPRLIVELGPSLTKELVCSL